MIRIAHVTLALALVAGCTKASTTNETNNQPGATPRAKASVTLTSVTFGDDCGGTAPSDAPAPSSPAVVAEPSRAARRRCEQTSMQLAVAGQADAELHIRSVEVFDEAGKSIGTLTASKPTRWLAASSTYDAWDEHVGAGETERVSYVLSQPGFVDRYDSHDRTYTVKVVASVAGVDQPLQTTVMVVAQPPPVPT